LVGAVVKKKAMTPEQKGSKSPFPNPTQIELACDGDLHTRWKSAGAGTLRARMTVGAAIVGSAELLEPEDVSPPSEN